MIMMPGCYDSYAHRYTEPEWQKCERYEYCDAFSTLRAERNSGRHFIKFLKNFSTSGKKEQEQ